MLIGSSGTNLNGNLIKMQKLFIQENASKNVVSEMVAIFSRGRLVNFRNYKQNVCK